MSDPPAFRARRPRVRGGGTVRFVGCRAWERARPLENHRSPDAVVCVAFEAGTARVALRGGDERRVRVLRPGLWHVPTPGALRFGSGTVPEGVLIEYRTFDPDEGEGTQDDSESPAMPQFETDEVGLDVARLLRGIERDAPDWDAAAGAAASRDALVDLLLARCARAGGG